MKKRRIVALIAATVMALSLFAGCGSSNKPAADAKKVKIGLSTDEGGLNDKSFNQAADTGIKKAKTELGFEYKALESKQKEDYESNFEALINDNSGLIVGVGFQMETAVKNMSAKYKDKSFVIIDDVVDAPNVRSYTFRAQEGSFLMGVIAGKTTKTNKVGFVGGKDFPLINAFEQGFAAGVKSVNPAAAEGLISKDGKSAASMVKYADSFTDANKGYELAKSLYGAGADVVFHAAGGVGNGLFKAAKELKSQNKWAIGVDMDQAVMLPDYADVILSSCIKKVDTATYQAATDFAKGTFKNGVVDLGLKEDGVGIAETSSKNTPKDVLDLVAKYKQAIIDGKIKVPATRADGKAFAPVAVQ